MSLDKLPDQIDDHVVYFNRVYELLKNEEHWWCRFYDLSCVLFSIFVAEQSPMFEAFMNDMFHSLPVCYECVQNYHQGIGHCKVIMEQFFTQDMLFSKLIDLDLERILYFVSHGEDDFLLRALDELNEYYLEKLFCDVSIGNSLLERARTLSDEDPLSSDIMYMMSILHFHKSKILRDKVKELFDNSSKKLKYDREKFTFIEKILSPFMRKENDLLVEAPKHFALALKLFITAWSVHLNRMFTQKQDFFKLIYDNTFKEQYMIIPFNIVLDTCGFTLCNIMGNSTSNLKKKIEIFQESYINYLVSLGDSTDKNIRKYSKDFIFKLVQKGYDEDIPPLTTMDEWASGVVKNIFKQPSHDVVILVKKILHYHFCAESEKFLETIKTVDLLRTEYVPTILGQWPETLICQLELQNHSIDLNVLKMFTVEYSNIALVDYALIHRNYPEKVKALFVQNQLTSLNYRIDRVRKIIANFLSNTREINKIDQDAFSASVLYLLSSTSPELEYATKKIYEKLIIINPGLLTNGNSSDIFLISLKTILQQIRKIGITNCSRSLDKLIYWLNKLLPPILTEKKRKLEFLPLLGEIIMEIFSKETDDSNHNRYIQLLQFLRILIPYHGITNISKHENLFFSSENWITTFVTWRLFNPIQSSDIYNLWSECLFKIIYLFKSVKQHKNYKLLLTECIPLLADSNISNEHKSLLKRILNDKEKPVVYSVQTDESIKSVLSYNKKINKGYKASETALPKPRSATSTTTISKREKINSVSAPSYIKKIRKPMPTHDLHWEEEYSMSSIPKGVNRETSIMEDSFTWSSKDKSREIQKRLSPTVLDLYESILQWDYNKIKDRSKLIGLRESKFRPLQPRYVDYDQYLSVFEPLLKEEIRAHIEQGIEENKKKEESAVLADVQITGTKYCSIYFPLEDLRERYREKDLLAISSNDSTDGTFFGIIDKIERVEVFNSRSKAMIKVKIFNSKMPNRKIGAEIKIKVVDSLSTSFREFEALQSLKEISIRDFIFNPRRKNVNDVNTIPGFINQLSNANLFNESQLDSIKSVSRKNGFILIQGPPGTGKTTTILGIVSYLLQSKNKILICAPSNGAVDEICMRLIKGIYAPKDQVKSKNVKLGTAISPMEKTDLVKYIPRLMRFGITDNVPEDLKPFCLDQDDYGTKLKGIINETAIICTTLSSSGIKSLKQANQFDAIIIDEAAQAVELSSLVPLKYQCEKCIMVGDTNQLPATVISKTSIKYGYDNSLMGRLIENEYPSSMLNTQYRMHPLIRAFPSSYFYDGALQEGDNIIGETYTQDYHHYEIFNPVMFVDIETSKQSFSNNSATNKDEAEFIYTFLNQFKKQFNDQYENQTIGIITPYRGQLSLLKRKLKPLLRSNIEINTIDGFQGKEKDIIFFSCVRSQGIGFLADDRRLNVAITRAKYALWIFGNSNSLTQNKTWNSLISFSKLNDLYINSKDVNWTRQNANTLHLEVFIGVEPQIPDYKSLRIPEKRNLNRNTQPKNKTKKANNHRNPKKRDRDDRATYDKPDKRMRYQDTQKQN